MKLKNLFLHTIFLFVLAIIVCLPDYRKIISAPKGTFYSLVHGIFEDYYLDLSIIKQGRTQWVEMDQYTTEEVAPSRVHLLYLLMGKLANFTKFSDIEIYYLSIYSSLLIFYLFTYLLVGQLLNKKFIWPAMMLIFFASPLPKEEITVLGHKLTLGSGWWTYMDAYHRLILRPHHFISCAMLVAGAYLLILFQKKEKYRFLIGLIIATTLAILFSGIPGLIFVTAEAVILSLAVLLKILIKKEIFPKKIFLGLFVSILFSLWPMYFIQKEASSGFIGSMISNWGYQNFRPEIYPYLFSVYILSYGLLPVFVFLAIPAICKALSFKKILIFLLAIFPLVFYQLSVKGILPINKIRFVYSAPYVFGGILAIWGIEYFFGKIKSKVIKKISIFFLLTVFLLNAIAGLKSYWWPQLFEKDYYRNIYLSQNIMKALDYLKRNSKPYSNVMCTFYDGVFIPAFTYNKVYLGSESNTYQFYQKWGIVDNFFKGVMSLSDVKKLFQEHKIEYVFWDQGELPQVYQKILKPFFKNSEVTIYETYGLSSL